MRAKICSMINNSAVECRILLEFGKWLVVLSVRGGYRLLLNLLHYGSRNLRRERLAGPPPQVAVHN